MSLLALIEAAPEDPRTVGLAEAVTREGLAQPWWSTQEAALVLLALGRQQQLLGGGPGASGTVLAGERVIGTFGPDGTTFRDLPGTQPLRIRMTTEVSPGTVFYSLTTRGVPTDAAFRVQQAGLEVERSFLDRQGTPASMLTLLQGDLLVMRTRVRSLGGPTRNVVIENLLPAGLEVENPRLESTGKLPWVANELKASFLDIRDDRVLSFVDLPGSGSFTSHVLLRAVIPGEFRVPPVQAEAMYDAALRATGPRATLEIRSRP